VRSPSRASLSVEDDRTLIEDRQSVGRRLATRLKCAARRVSNNFAGVPQDGQIC